MIKLREIYNDINQFRELTEVEENNPFAVFVLIFLNENHVAATTRAPDRGELGKIGLPGGKVDPGESGADAAYRESQEEGWTVTGINKIVSSQMIEGKPVVWFLADSGEPLNDYKEKNRGIYPVVVSVDDISNSGYGNEFIKHVNPYSR